MAGLALTLNIAEQALLNTQTELSTSSNNISNANTDGYAVERAVQVENPSTWTSSGWLGTGASVTSISQARESFIEKQLMSATSSDSQYTTLASELTTIQSVAADSGSDGISEALGNFFDAWSTLAENPTGSAEQAGVYTASQSLVSSIQSTYNQLSQINGQIPTQEDDTVDQANTLIDQIAQLNTAIVANSASGSDPNSLIDQRYQDMDSLSKLIPASFSTQPNGMVTVSCTLNGNASPTDLVSSGTAQHLSYTDTVTGGKLGGLQEAQTDLSGYMSSLDDFASTLTSAVYSASGLSIFSGTTASSLTVNSNFLSGETSTQLATVTQGMSDLQDSAVSFSSGTSTLQDYLDNLQQTIGNDVSAASTNQSFYDSLKTELQTQQQSVSGVSIDEEMVNVIQFQQIYQAAAKVVSTTQTLMSTAINMVQ